MTIKSIYFYADYAAYDVVFFGGDVLYINWSLLTRRYVAGWFGRRCLDDGVLCNYDDLEPRIKRLIDSAIQE